MSSVGLNSISPVPVVYSSPIYISSYKLGFLSRVSALSCKEATGKYASFTLIIASAGVIGSSA